MSSAIEIADMPAEVDFSASIGNPYAGRLRSRVTMNIDDENIDYFKEEAARTGIPYQNIINLYLTECRVQRRHLAFT